MICMGCVMMCGDSVVRMMSENGGDMYDDDLDDVVRMISDMYDDMYGVV